VADATKSGANTGECFLTREARAQCIFEARNKPVEAPKAPERAPFFLPTLPGTTTKFDMAKPLIDSSNGKTKTSASFFHAAVVESEAMRALKNSDNACAIGGA
jgi:hypothetical protein